jgi:cell division septation protein DedD
MAYQPNPNDPHGTNLSDDEIRHQARLNSLDNELQPDPELAEGPASGARVAMFAIAIAVVLGAVFYGLNNTTIKQAGTTPPSQTAQTQTPKANSEPGTTTGTATTRPMPPQSNPSGTEVDRSANPPSGNK